MREAGAEGPREANLRVLAAAQPELAAFLADIEAPALELLPTPSGLPTARREGRLLHSSRDPRAEARRLARAARGSGCDCLIVLGAGLGYGLEAALEEEGLEKVLLCEADPAKLASLLASRDLGPLLGDPRLSWVLGGDPGGLLAALAASEARLPALLGQAGLESFDAEWYRGLRGAFGRWKAKEEINDNTLARFGRLWVRNLARNAPSFPLRPGIGALEGLGRGLPALVLAAGPSLDEVLPLLGELRERCLLVAVDTALRSLLSRGLEPDFLLVVDPQYWNYRHVADLESPSSFLVSEPAVFPPVLRRRQRGLFLAESLFPLGRLLAGRGRGLLGAGGSVATSAWDFARHLGCSPLYLAGLDLGFPEGHTHARASLFEQRALAAGLRLRPAATEQTAALFGAPGEEVPSNGGGRLRSDQRMALYAWWFESRLARAGSPESCSLSARSRAIAGLPWRRPEELLELPPRRAEIETLLAVCEARAALPLDFDFEGARASLCAGLAEARALALRGLEAARSGLRDLERGGGAGEALRLLAEADEGLHANAMRDVVGFLLPPLRTLLSSPARDLAESLSLSEGLYAAIAASAAEQLELLAAADPA